MATATDATSTDATAGEQLCLKLDTMHSYVLQDPTLRAILGASEMLASEQLMDGVINVVFRGMCMLPSTALHHVIVHFCIQAL